MGEEQHLRGERRGTVLREASQALFVCPALILCD